jgi:integrase
MADMPRHTIFTEYLGYLGHKGVAASTLEKNGHALVRWERWLASQGMDPANVPPIRAHEYFGTVLSQPGVPGDQSGRRFQALSRSTRRQHLVSVKAAYSYAIDFDLVSGKNPCRRLTISPVPLHERHFLAPSDIRAALAACRSSRERLIVATFAFTGLRLHEVASLRWQPSSLRNRHGEPVAGSWIDLDGRRLRVLGKGERARVVPIHSALLPRLQAAAGGASDVFFLRGYQSGGLTAWSLSHILSQILDRAGIKRPGSRAHAFRRAFNDSLIVNGRGYDAERRAIMGHSDTRDVNLSFYARPSVERLAELVERVYLDDPVV